ncbi:MAG: ABC transporter substrate-binding protein [Ruminiclostridium sp.]|nr:ABC transporter substrate-binding protein [Ruminiclostridium sp.]
MKKYLALLLALVMVLGLCACGGTAEEPAPEEETQTETVELEKIVFTEPVRGYHWAPVYLAQTLGYFAEEGLEAEFQSITGTPPHAALFSGDAQYTLVGIETALMCAEGGQGVKVLASTSQKYPYSLIGATEDYTTLESLKDGIVAGGVNTAGGPYSFAMACVNHAGLTPEVDVSVITMASVGYAAAIDAGELQAAVSTNPWSEKNLLDLGGQVIVDGTDDAAIEEIIGSSSYELFVMMASDAYIAENGETVQKVVNAVAKAMQWMENATPEEIAENLLPLFEGAQEELLYDANYDKERSITSYTGYHTESGYQAAINLTKLAGGITKDIPAEEIYDDSFLDAAWEALK